MSISSPGGPWSPGPRPGSGAVRPTAGRASPCSSGADGRDAARLDAAARDPSAPPRVSSAAQSAADQIASVRFKSQLDLE